MGIVRGIFDLDHGCYAGIIAFVWRWWMNQKCICCGGKILFLYFVSTIPTMILHGMNNYMVILQDEGFLEGTGRIFNLMGLLPFTIFVIILAQKLREIEDNRRSEE